MTMTLELPDDVATALVDEANRRGVTVYDFAVSLLARPKTAERGLTDGASVVNYLESEGLLGTRTDITDTLSEARRLRAISNSRIGEL